MVERSSTTAPATSGRGEADAIALELNERPRQTLGFKTHHKH
jgi:IS30 family transposase